MEHDYSNYPTQKCYICNGQTYANHINSVLLYTCPVCGKYFLEDTYFSTVVNKQNADKRSRLVHYLYHHNSDGRYKYIGTYKGYEGFIKKHDFKPIVRVDFDIVENWYPKTFAEKIDKILLKLYSLSKFEGDYIDYTPFIRSLFLTNEVSDTIVHGQEQNVQMNYLLRYLINEGYIKSEADLQLMPKALERIYELQKNQIGNKNAFVAMKFGDETAELREKLKEGIREAGYEPIIMDEIEHNHQIVPEMLYQIKNSKFLIAELSHHNNGAYYEAGYALGLGKEVIHICKRSELSDGLHFDVAQVNTIVYDDIEELPAKIVKRIKATIG